jgi:anti-anti-sigma regulatory factor
MPPARDTSSAALHILAELAMRLWRRGGVRTLLRPRKPVADPLELTGAATMMSIEPRDGLLAS